MNTPVAFLFSGQGSHYYNMGDEFLKNLPAFKKHMLDLDDIAREIMGESVMGRVYDTGKSRGTSFDRTLYSHPALFMVQYSLAQALIEMGVEPQFVLGTSLGEFVAAAVAGILKPDEALEFVIKQAQCFEEYCNPGGMLAVLHSPDLYFESPVLYENSELVSISYNEHFVLSGDKAHLESIKRYLINKSIACQMLSVSFAFHSKGIDQAEHHYIKLLMGKRLKKPCIPYLSCVYGDFSDNFSKEYFWEVVRKPILFKEAVSKLREKGLVTYVDISPGGTILNFVKKNVGLEERADIFSIMNPLLQNIKNFNAVVSSCTKKCKERQDEKMISYVFPGQGSQSKGMGAELFDEFNELTVKASEILGYSIKDLCLEDRDGNLAQTNYTQPALYVVNALTYYKKLKETGKTPDFVAGHSLGEYNALLAAGVFDFETGLRIVKYRGELMSKVSAGGMAAVTGMDENKVRQVLRDNCFTGIDVANINTPSQIVLSGLSEDIQRAKPAFEAAGARGYIVLKVSGAFHSRYMENAKQQFGEFINQFEFSRPQIPVIANVNARPYRNFDINKNMAEQITSSVMWTDSIRYLMGKGDVEIVQVGPGSVVAGLVRNILKEAEPLVVNDIEEEAPKIVEEKEPAKKEGNRKDVAKKEAVKKEKNEKIVLQAVTAETLGCEEFKKDYNLIYAYVTGAMYRGVASKEIVVKVGKAGMMGFLGTGGLELRQIEEDIKYIQKELKNGQAYGMNLLHNHSNVEMEERHVDLYMKYGIHNIEAAAYMSITPALVKYRVHGLSRGPDEVVNVKNRIIAKVSRPEVAKIFLSPAPERLVEKMLGENKITSEQAEMLKKIPMADDLCVEADSGGHTDAGVAYVLMPAMLKLRDEMMEKYAYRKRIRVGAAGGIGTPEAAVSAFVMGADFIVTGSVNQCTVEANTSDAVKDLLQEINVQDTQYAPAGDMFEMGAKVQVLGKGVFFPARANKLYDLYRQYNSLDEIDEKTRNQIQEKYFKLSFDKVYKEVKEFYPCEAIEKAEKNPKQKMAMIFKWYFGYSTRLALSGTPGHQVDYQVHCGPALGAFNQWVKGTGMESWQNRHVDEIGTMLMSETAELMKQRVKAIFSK